MKTMAPRAALAWGGGTLVIASTIATALMGWHHVALAGLALLAGACALGLLDGRRLAGRRSLEVRRLAAAVTEVRNEVAALRAPSPVLENLTISTEQLLRENKGFREKYRRSELRERELVEHARALRAELVEQTRSLSTELLEHAQSLRAAQEAGALVHEQASEETRDEISSSARRVESLFRAFSAREETEFLQSADRHVGLLEQVGAVTGVLQALQARIDALPEVVGSKLDNSTRVQHDLSQAIRTDLNASASRVEALIAEISARDEAELLQSAERHHGLLEQVGAVTGVLQALQARIDALPEVVDSKLDDSTRVQHDLSQTIRTDLDASARRVEALIAEISARDETELLQSADRHLALLEQVGSLTGSVGALGTRVDAVSVAHASSAEVLAHAVEERANAVTRALRATSDSLTATAHTTAEGLAAALHATSDRLDRAWLDQVRFSDLVETALEQQVERQEAILAGVREAAANGAHVDAANAVQESAATIADAVKRSGSTTVTNLTKIIRTETQQVEAMLQLLPQVSPRAPLPASGRPMAMDARSLLHLADIVREVRPTTVLELGSGTSTVWLGYLLEGTGARIISVDHDAKYGDATSREIERHRLSDSVHVTIAPLRETHVEGVTYHFYDLESAGAFDGIDSIDLLLVDGPPGTLNSHARFPALEAARRHLAPDAWIVLDDSDRRDERETLERWHSAMPGYELEGSNSSRLGVLRPSTRKDLDHDRALP